MELYVWQGDFGLPSIAPECIETLLYLKLAKVPVEVIYMSNVFSIPNYPTFRHGALSLTDLEELVRYLRWKKYFINYTLTSKQTNDSYVIDVMIQSQLRPLLYYLLWLDESNFEFVTRKWFKRSLKFPSNFVYISKQRRLAVDLVAGGLLLCPEDTNDLPTTMEIVANQCFKSLCIHLGDKQYFNDDLVITSLDATVYAYLAPILKIPMPSNKIQNMLVQTFPKLVKYVHRVDEQIFPEVLYRNRYNINCPQLPAELRPARGWTAVVFCVIVMLGIVGYAQSNNTSNVMFDGTRNASRKLQSLLTRLRDKYNL